MTTRWPSRKGPPSFESEPHCSAGEPLDGLGRDGSAGRIRQGGCMKLTPQDISNQTFASKIKGFDRDEVKNFLIQVVETLESEITEKEELKKGLEKFKENCAKYERREELLRDTLIAAQKFSGEIKLNAQKEGEL